MKIFIVFAVVIASSYANSVGRVGSGWGSNKPSNTIFLGGAGAAAGAGQASGQQALAELVAGSPEIPAVLSSENGILSAGLQQGDTLSQIATVDKPSGASSTINTADTNQDVLAIDGLEAAAIGEYIAVQNSANTDASGEGALAADAETINDSVTIPSGWKH